MTALSREPSSCEKCGKALKQGARGPRKRFCDDRCRLSRPHVLVIDPGASQGVMQATAARVAKALGRQADALTDARAVSLQQIALGLDLNPASAALWSQWLSLLRDLQRGQDGGDAARTELDAVLADIRPKVRR
jgi:hypothetical protein